MFTFILANHGLECCASESAASQSPFQCFYKASVGRGISQELCHSARMLLNSSSAFCNYPSDCPTADQECVIPKLFDENESLIKLSYNSNQFIAFLGHPVYIWNAGTYTTSSLLFSVEVSEYIPRLFIFPANLPHMCERALEYTYSMSAALAIFNIAPADLLDGGHAFAALLKVLFPLMREHKKTKIVNFTNYITYGLLSLNLFLSVFALLRG